MQTREFFKKGDKVKVVRHGFNDSDSCMDNNLNPGGVYSISFWGNLTFEIEGAVKLHSFDHDPKVFCSYLLLLNGNPIGYVYNTGLEVVKEPEYKVGDWVVVKNYRQADDLNGVETENLITKLYDTDSDEVMGKVSGMYDPKSPFIVFDPFIRKGENGGSDKGYRRIKDTHIIRKATEEEIKEVKNLFFVDGRSVTINPRFIMVDGIIIKKKFLEYIEDKMAIEHVKFNNGVTFPISKMREVLNRM